MAHDCGEQAGADQTTHQGAAPQDCCVANAPNSDALLSDAIQVAPPTSVATVVSLGERAPVSLGAPFGSGPDTLKPPGVPTYLLASVFRI
jgi:hypothetical protein